VCLRLVLDVPAVREGRLRPDRAEDQRVYEQDLVPGATDHAPFDHGREQGIGILGRVQLAAEVRQVDRVCPQDLAQDRSWARISMNNRRPQTSGAAS
jgi:hypothetical protein